MSYNFGDSFDLYATALSGADMVNGYWDSLGNSFNIAAGRFTGSRALTIATINGAVSKSSGINDPVHHLVCSLMQGQAITGSSSGFYLTLLDGVTAQCTILFRSDGAILLQSGAVGGATLATYTGAFPVISTWYAFEFEVVINNATGSFAVRKNGNTVNDFSATSLNTRPTSTNNYANKLTLGNSASMAQTLDDFYWQSGAATGTWLGDIRCYTRMPASNQSIQFSKFPTVVQPNSGTGGASSSSSANTIYSYAVLGAGGTLVSLSLILNGALTGHLNMAVYDTTGASGGPGALIAQSTAVTNPASGLNTFLISGSPAIVNGVFYWVAVWSDAATFSVGNSPGVVSIRVATLTYTGTFPSTMPAFSSSGTSWGSATMNIIPLNSTLVGEAQQDGATTYVYDSNPGDADWYGFAGTVGTPAYVVATTIRGYMTKPDAGTRIAEIQLQSGATIVATPPCVLTPSNWQWAWRTDVVDPNTGAAWAASSVNVALVGPVVIA